MIAVCSDHAGFRLKEAVKEYLDGKGIPYRDFGTQDAVSVDYAVIAKTAADSIVAGECEKGIFCCGTGIGISMAANKVKGIRAACCGDYFSAKMTRLHNDANVLCMGERVIGLGTALEMVEVFLTTDFEGGRHARRVAQLADIENGTL